MTHRTKPEQNLRCYMHGGESPTAAVDATVYQANDFSLASIMSEKMLDYQSYGKMLSDHLRFSNISDNYSKIDCGSFCFQRAGLKFSTSIRRDRKAIDFSCVIYMVNNNKKDGKPVSYSLMTMMMKYKAIFQQKTQIKQIRPSLGINQIGTWNGKFLYIQSMPLDLLQARERSYFSLELHRFCALAKEMKKDFIWTECRAKK
mmetsp:Transcript_22043/g.33447  ORF Transcript_22043/g.33447 Transcript_22043/m.33447 type:complete len:202 (-) Transcript_22043:45-650(-)